MTAITLLHATGLAAAFALSRLDAESLPTMQTWRTIGV
jgi:hypothetical protein